MEGFAKVSGDDALITLYLAIGRAVERGSGNLLGAKERTEGSDISSKFSIIVNLEG